MYQFGYIGTGVMAGAMLERALAAGFLQPAQVMVFDKNPAAAGRFGVAVAESAADCAAQCDILQLGVKPQDQPALLESLWGRLADKLVISIAAGVPLEKIAPYAPRAVRLMPNINAQAGQAMTAYCGTAKVAAEELAFVQAYCRCFGEAIALEERLFSAFLAVAASAPAYVFLFVDELARAGVSAGLPRSQAFEIALQTVQGSAALLRESGLHPCELTDRVCSPAGTTIAGVNALREHGFAHAVSQAVLAACRRDQELGK